MTPYFRGLAGIIVAASLQATATEIELLGRPTFEEFSWRAFKIGHEGPEEIEVWLDLVENWPVMIVKLADGVHPGELEDRATHVLVERLHPATIFSPLQGTSSFEENPLDSKLEDIDEWKRVNMCSVNWLGRGDRGNPAPLVTFLNSVSFDRWERIGLTDVFEIARVRFVNAEIRKIDLRMVFSEELNETFINGEFSVEPGKVGTFLMRRWVNYDVDEIGEYIEGSHLPYPQAESIPSGFLFSATNPYRHGDVPLPGGHDYFVAATDIVKNQHSFLPDNEFYGLVWKTTAKMFRHDFP